MEEECEFFSSDKKHEDMTKMDASLMHPHCSCGKWGLRPLTSRGLCKD